MIEFSPEQERAIDSILQWYGSAIRGGKKEFYLAGYAGVGKSTVCAEAISRIKNLYGITNVPTAAYTGKAAYVLRKKGNANAQTIHSMIYTHYEDPKTGETEWLVNETGPAAAADLIVLDECSMIDAKMAEDLRSFGKPLLIMGDPGQLPPVNGIGAFHHEPDVFLQEIHRQCWDSPIIELATMARKGMALPIGYSKGDVKVMRLTNETSELLHNPDTQVICGLNRVRWSVTQLMRNRLGYNGVWPQIGERILCCKNNREKGLYNGGMGVLRKLEIRDPTMQWHDAYDISPFDYDKENYKIRIEAEIEGTPHHKLVADPTLFKQHFDSGASKKNPKSKIPNEFDWGYVLTCHKAQGSSFNHVTLIDDSDSFRESKFKWLYTGITRSETGLTILVK